MPTLYGSFGSPFVRKVVVALGEKGIAFDHDPVVPFGPNPGYRKISPLGKIPAFRDGDRTLADSSVIIAYLERTHPLPTLYPSDPYEYARALWFEEYGDGGLAPVMGPKIFAQRVLAPSIGRATKRRSRRRSTRKFRRFSTTWKTRSAASSGWCRTDSRSRISESPLSS